MSNFRPVKRIGAVVDVFAQVRARMPATLVLVGEGPELEPARQRLRALGLEADVEFAGERLDIVDVLSQADVFLLPSATESFGLAALEAMACEVPVVASRVGGLPEVIDDGVTGFLHAPEDVEGMVRSVVALFGDHAAAYTDRVGRPHGRRRALLGVPHRAALRGGLRRVARQPCVATEPRGIGHRGTEATETLGFATEAQRPRSSSGLGHRSAEAEMCGRTTRSRRFEMRRFLRVLCVSVAIPKEALSGLCASVANPLCGSVATRGYEGRRREAVARGG